MGHAAGITQSATEHGVVIIDVGSKDMADTVPKKTMSICACIICGNGQKQNMKAPCDNVRSLWRSKASVDNAIEVLDKMWTDAPLLTVVSRGLLWPPVVSRGLPTQNSCVLKYN